MDSETRLSVRVAKSWLYLLPLWVGTLLASVTISHRMTVLDGHPMGWGELFRLSIPYYMSWVLILTPVTAYLAWRFPLEPKRFRRHIPIHLVALFVLTFLDGALLFVLEGFQSRRNPSAGVAWSLEVNFLQGLLDDIFAYGVIAASVMVVSYYQKLAKEQIQSLQLKSQLATAQLAVLENQLQPHFLFNALHVISALIYQDARAADKVIEHLGDLLRMSLARTDAYEISLREELSLLDKYLEIQKIRFPDRLSVNLSAPAEVLDAQVPHFMLQLLVENAIKHGIGPRVDPGLVDIQIHQGAGLLYINVTNDGPSNNTEMQSQNNGVGLNNLRARLGTLYGDGELLQMTRLPDHRTQVSVAIPFKVIKKPFETVSDHAPDHEWSRRVAKV